MLIVVVDSPEMFIYIYILLLLHLLDMCNGNEHSENLNTHASFYYQILEIPTEINILVN